MPILTFRHGAINQVGDAFKDPFQAGIEAVGANPTGSGRCTLQPTGQEENGGIRKRGRLGRLGKRQNGETAKRENAVDQTGSFREAQGWLSLKAAYRGIDPIRLCRSKCWALVLTEKTAEAIAG